VFKWSKKEEIHWEKKTKLIVETPTKTLLTKNQYQLVLTVVSKILNFVVEDIEEEEGVSGEDEENTLDEESE
jgi:hypothetical protein